MSPAAAGGRHDFPHGINPTRNQQQDFHFQDSEPVPPSCCRTAAGADGLGHGKDFSWRHVVSIRRSFLMASSMRSIARRVSTHGLSLPGDRAGVAGLWVFRYSRSLGRWASAKRRRARACKRLKL